MSGRLPTEHFFEQPGALLENHPDLYGVLADYYGQDPAGRARRFEFDEAARSRSV